jgi:hypothetical protein
MDSGQLKLVPDSFLGKLLNRFGIQWTHLAILSGVLFSSFHLEEYLNPGLWMLGTLAAFSLVYLYSDEISENFLKVSIWCALIGLGLLLVPVATLFALGQDIPAFIKQWSQAVTIYLSLAIGIPAGIMILSYRNRDEQRSPLPPALALAAKQAVQSDFIHESVSYEIEFLPTPEKKIVMQFTAIMNLVNRSSRKVTYRDIFDPAGSDRDVFYATIKQQPINTKSPDRQYGRGVLLAHEAEPNERFEIVVRGRSTFHERDSELVGVYLPCSSLTVRVKKPPNGLEVNIQSLLPGKNEAQVQPNGDILFQYADGVLPFQGTRVFWQPASSRSGVYDGPAAYLPV